jgi:hydrogenase expression/formation protein HypC
MCLGIPAQIVALDEAGAGLAKAQISGVRRSVSVALCPEAEVGDWVLVHVGFALARIDETEARETLTLLEQMGEAYEQELRELRSSAQCTTCGDSAVAATVLGVAGATATVDADGARERVGIELVDGVTAGDVLLCHAGIALERVERA